MLGNEKGIAMLLVISLVIMLLILGGAVLMVSTGHFGTTYHQIRQARAFYAAEAGMQHALWKCRDGGYYDLDNGSTDAITVQDPNYSFVVNITIGAKDAQVQGLNAISAKVIY